MPSAPPCTRSRRDPRQARADTMIELGNRLSRLASSAWNNDRTSDASKEELEDFAARLKELELLAKALFTKRRRAAA